MPLDAPADLPTRLLARGVSWFTVADASRETGQSATEVLALLKRLSDRGDVVSPARGLYLPVAPDQRPWGAPPALDYIDAMMRHLDRRYYVGLLTAAEQHGVAHQRPQSFQVIVNRALADRRVGRTHLRFYTSGKLDQTATTTTRTRTGSVQISTPETTAFDLASRPRASGGLDNVATVIAEMVEENLFDLESLGAASQGYPASAVRRVGWILDHLCGVDVRGHLDATEKEPTMLDPHSGRAGHVDPVWRVIVNAQVNPDL